MAQGTLSPVAIQQFFDNSGRPLAGGKLGLFAAGTNTPLPAYSDVNLAVPLSNPVILDAAGRAPELFLSAASYKQVLQDAAGVTLWTADNIYSAAFLGQLIFQPSVTNLSTAGTIHNVDTGTAHARVLACANNAGDITITGFAAGNDGDTLLIVANGTSHVYLQPEHAGSLPTSRLTNCVRTGPTPLVGGFGTALYQYLGVTQRWRLINHDMGHSLPIPYNAANYAAVGGTWTVPEASIYEHRYILQGSTIGITLAITPSTIGGTPSSLYILGWPYQFVGALTPPGQHSQHAPWPYLDGAAWINIISWVQESGNALNFQKQTGNLTAGTTSLYGQVRLEVK